MLCRKCGGTGQYMGNGMTMINCYNCDESGHTIQNKSIDEKNIAVDKSSKSYKDSIKDIMKLNPGISRAKAVKMFDEAYEKI